MNKQIEDKFLEYCKELNFEVTERRIHDEFDGYSFQSSTWNPEFWCGFLIINNHDHIGIFASMLLPTNRNFKDYTNIFYNRGICAKESTGKKNEPTIKLLSIIHINEFTLNAFEDSTNRIIDCLEEILEMEGAR